MRDLIGQPGSLSDRKKYAHSRRTTIRLLWLLIVASILLPLLLFGIASWLSYRDLQALGIERIERTQAVIQEHALKVFESLTLALDTIDDLLRNLTAEEIQVASRHIHERIKEIKTALPEVQSIWIFGPTGHPQVITREYPAPFERDYSDNDYFSVPRDGYRGTYVGEIHLSVTGGRPYFTFSRARYMGDGSFAGVIELSLQPDDFSRFYARLANAPGLQFALFRNDGLVLARYPQVDQINTRLSERSGFFRTLSANAEGGFYKTVSEVDHVERNFEIKRIPGFPVYTSAGIATDELRREWLYGMALHLIFGVPATLFLCGTLFLVLQRTKRLYAEQDLRLIAEDTLRQSQKLEVVGQLTGGIAHDFNNLLTIIIGNAEILQRQLERGASSNNERIENRIEMIMQGARRAASLISKLLAFSRQQPLVPKVINVNHLINGLADFLHRTLGEDISLEIVGAAGLWPVEIDPAQLEAAILNLAVNARDAMPDGGSLTIETSNSFLDELYVSNHPDVRPGQYVQIAVTDSGSGMSKNVLDRAFEPFFTTKAAGQGTGLGLSQVYGFIKQSGGHIKIYSEPGEGTTVRLYLHRHVGAAMEETEAKLPVKASTLGETILVVEDDAEVRSYIAEILSDLKYNVIEAPVGEIALKQMNAYEGDIDVLLTDVVMPAMNGRKLADRAKELRPSLKILFMTGYSRNAIIHQGRLDAGVDLIQKPITSEELSTTLRKILDSGP